MEVVTTTRGFECLEHDYYPPNGEKTRLAQQSSAIGDYKDSFDKPGSSFLWVGKHHHLNRKEVRQFVRYLRQWLKTGSLEL